MNEMNDFKQIPEFGPSDEIELFDENKEWLEKTLAESIDMQCVVITHHLPSEQCIDEQYKDSPLNKAYYSDLDYLMDGKNLQLWIHGSIAGHTFVSERKPTYFEAFTHGGLCFIVALFMENIDFFASMYIVSPYALLRHLERNNVGVNFKLNRMLESDDITKIANFLKVRIPVKSINMGVLANIFPAEEVLGGSRVEIGAVTLDMMGGQGGGHYIVEGLN
jgi:hypothetical protein